MISFGGMGVLNRGFWVAFAGLLIFSGILGGSLRIPQVGRPLHAGPVADPGGPYRSVEGSPVSFDGSHSRGSTGDNVTFGMAAVVNQPDAASPDGDGALVRDSQGTVYVAWLRKGLGVPGNGNDQVLFVRRDPNGSFSPPLVIDSKDSQTGGLGRPAVTTGANQIYVAWTSSGFGTHGIFLRKSSNRGESFGSARLVFGNHSYDTNIPWTGAVVFLDRAG